MKLFKIKVIVFVLIVLAVFGIEINSNVVLSSTATPIFVEISTQWCGACKTLKPTIEELKKEYAGKVIFLLLDATSETSLLEANKIAQMYGISEFFNNNKNAFPRVGIFCSNSSSPDNNILGAYPKESYKTTLDEILNRNSCNLHTSNTQVETVDSGQSRPPQPNYPEIIGTRPSEPSLSDRPVLPIISGRPEELSFWHIGQTIPLYAYFQYFKFPECTGNQNIVCANYSNAQNSIPDNQPTFTPWDPNATRNEKGFNSFKKGK